MKNLIVKDTAAAAPFRVLYNQDCSNVFSITQEPIKVRHLHKIVDEVADGGADVFLVNPNSQKANYPSKVWQTYWEGCADISTASHFVQQVKHLADGGTDYLATMLARCRERKIIPGVSLRMNDMHGAPDPNFQTHNRFWLRNPQFRLPYSIEERGWSGHALNYEHLEVREHFLSLIREIVNDYDLEVLELDFLRHKMYFPIEPIGKYAPIMTDFLRQVKTIIQQSGKPIKLIPRVASTPAAAMELHFDIRAWVAEGLIDGLTAAMYHSTGWEIPVAEFRSVLGPDVPLYIGTEFGADKRGDLPRRLLPREPELLKGLAAGYLAAGADGINFFNFFCAREANWMSSPEEPLFEMLGQLKSLDALRSATRTHLITCGGCRYAPTDLPGQIPMTTNPRWASRFTMMIAKPQGSGLRVEAAFLLQSEVVRWPVEQDKNAIHVPANRLWLHVNETACGRATEVVRGPTPPENIERIDKSGHPFYWVRFDVPADALRDGENILTFRNDFQSAVVMGVEMRFIKAWQEC